MINYKNVDDYISKSAKEVRPILKELQQIIKASAPNAVERISYGMPFYEYGGTGFKGRLIYFAAFKKHISLFIPPLYANKVPAEMKKYHISKATFRFPLNKPLPFSIIKKTVKSIMKERKEEILKQNT